MSKKFDIVSVGDCVMDFFYYVDHMPKVGETLGSKSFLSSPGGKGANSIVAASRLGSSNAFISKVGNDSFGKDFINILKADNINTDHVTFTTTEKATSCASIVVDNNSHNFCLVNHGATLDLDPNDVNDAEQQIKNSRILVTTRMVKEETALQALKVAKKNELITIFNFAPAISDLNEEFNIYVDLLIVNEIEAEAFIGCKVKSLEDAFNACKIIFTREGFSIGCVVTLGEQGCVYGDKKTKEIKHFPCVPCNPVDSTGAGDSFVGALAHYMSFLGTDSMHKAIELASEYATLSVTRKGTQTSYWYLKELNNKFHVSRKEEL